jgi:uracil-DNA glycosylase
MSFEKLKNEYSTCTRCPLLCDTRTQVVFGSGNSNAKIILIGEAPGANEDKNGIPFCGMSGKILDELLISVGLSREDIFITNTILCRPPKNRNPKKEEVENCRERLDQLIEIMKPEVIVTIGNFATERIINKTGIKSIRGKVFNYNNIKVIPVVHPASYLYSGRNPDMFNEMKNDFEKINSLVDITKSQKNLFEF